MEGPFSEPGRYCRAEALLDGTPILYRAAEAEAGNEMEQARQKRSFYRKELVFDT